MTRPYTRPVRPNEAGDLAALVRASITELCTADHGGNQTKIDRWLSNKTEDEIQAWLKRNNMTIFVTDTGHQIVTNGCHDARGVVLINYIAPAHRLQGLSSAMLAHLERRMRQTGITEFRLVSTATAQGFYKRRG